MSNNITIVGLQWGDEGKGKLTDFYSENAAAIVRFQGGNNAGHTVIVNDKTYKFNIMPSGVLHGKLAVIGNGVVLNMSRLIEEITALRADFEITPKNLLVSENAALIIPGLHPEMDAIFEGASGKAAVGTTKRGIGPAYMDKIGRFAIKAGDLLFPDSLPEKVDRLLFLHNAIRRGCGEKEASASHILDYLNECGEALSPFIGNVGQRLYEIKKSGGRIIFEGAQGSMLDIDHGSFPMVTSSNTIAAQASIGTGVPPSEIGFVLGIVKAYTTRVGNGFFPTELNDEVGEYLGKAGSEIGVTTGRSRRCGWFDAPLAARSAYLSGVNGAVITKLDVLDELSEIKVCVGYEIDGEKVPFLFNAKDEAMSKVVPIYETLPGWKTSIKGMKNLADLPTNARRYLDFIEKHIGVRIIAVSTGPERSETIEISKPVLR
ncbi:MAG: adenylosuccinate synthase [Holosporaceae bacterium]|jgi:adenylosuccinate synthase|nr:adenylosuccinate synthase [Holosporaceae bacterium]